MLKLNGKVVVAGMTVRDLLTEDILTVVKVDKDVVSFGNGLTVNSLDTFKFIDYSMIEEYADATGVSLNEGILSVNGNIVDSGTLKIDKVLKVLPNLVYLVVKSLDGSKYEIFSYDILNDEFIQKGYPFDSLEVLLDKDKDEESSSLLVARVSNKKEKVLTAEEVENLKKYKEYVVYDDVNDTYLLAYHEYKLYAFNSKVVSGSNTFVASEINFELITHKGNNHIFTFVLDNSSEVFSISYDYYDEDFCVESISFDNETIEDVSVTHNDSLLIVTNNGFAFSNNGWHPRYAKGPVAKKAIKDFPYFIDLEAGSSRNVFTLANENRETIKLEIVKTQDRGYTTNIL